MGEQAEILRWAYFDGTSYRCKTCLTVTGSVGESRRCPCPDHRRAIAERSQSHPIHTPENLNPED